MKILVGSEFSKNYTTKYLTKDAPSSEFLQTCVDAALNNRNASTIANMQRLVFKAMGKRDKSMQEISLNILRVGYFKSNINFVYLNLTESEQVPTRK